MKSLSLQYVASDFLFVYFNLSAWFFKKFPRLMYVTYKSKVILNPSKAFSKLYSTLHNCMCVRMHQFSSVIQLCLTLRDPMNRNKPGLPVHYQLPEFTQTHVH